MKIVLILIPSPFLGDQKRNISLGLMYIASYLEINNYGVEVVDLRDIEETEWLNHIPSNNVYGITATTPEYSTAIKISKLLKKRDKKCKIILGGLHGTVSHINDDVIDSTILGEGELSIINALNDYKENKLKKTYSSPLIKNLDVLPFPARHMLSENSFINKNLCEEGIRATTIIASRGCPFNCAYCASVTMWERRMRYRSPENVILEIQSIIDKYDVKQFRFQDDTITANKKWMLKFCDLIKDLNIKWRANTRTDCIEKELLKKMFEAGCYELDFGVEDVSQHVTDIINKGIKVEEIYTTINNTKEAGIKVRIFLMIGLPGQGHDVSTNVINFIKKTNPDAVDLSSFIPLPGSDIYNNLKKYNIKLKEGFDSENYVFTVGLYGDEINKNFVFEHDILTNEELKKYRKEILEYIQERKMVHNK